MSFDLKAYFRRIGYKGGLEPSLETLSALCRLHPQAIAFENLNPLMGWPVALDSAALEQKMVAGGRGGYCHEHGLLLMHALEALGFEVSGLSARVIKNLPPSGQRARTHMLLRVRVTGADYVADAGFGISTLTAPLRLKAGIPQATPHETYRLTSRGDAYEMQVKVDDDWDGLYRFDLQPQTLADYEMCTFYTSTHPASQFVTDLMAARADDGCRHTLRNGFYALRFPDGRSDRRTLTTVAELRAVLTDIFRIALPDTPDLDPALERVLARTQGEGS